VIGAKGSPVKHLSLIGATGSIGSQTLEVVSAHRDRLKIVAMASGAKSLEDFAQKIKDFEPELVSVPDERSARELTKLLGGFAARLSVLYGDEGLEQVAVHALAETIVTGVVGFLGLKPTAAAVKMGKTIALANKETLVSAGAVIVPLARQSGARLIPVDSEHSAIHQSLSGYGAGDLSQIWLTASGGPFRTWSSERMRSATISDALKHPNWSMGKKITIDSATLMNKGLEIIEARWLFDVQPEKIKVVIHPQSILHSAVEFVDGSIIGQFGVPDMRLPIHYALFHPERVASSEVPRLNLAAMAELTFEEPDLVRFPCLKIAQEIAKENNTLPSVLNAANEILVEAFLNERIKFYDISESIRRVLERHKPVSKPALEDILEADSWARQEAQKHLSAVK
jgi:1-deoxy-D-xylulose-5-phosphate reductoisomerase